MAEPLCKYFGKCGGCALQHIDCPMQLESKKKSLLDAIHFSDIKIFSGKEYYYRNRMDMIFHPEGLGLRKKGEYLKIVDIEKCAISNDRLNVILKEVRDYFKNIDCFDLKKQSGTFRYAVIRTPSNDSSVSFVLNEESPKLSEAIEKIKDFAEKTSASNVVVAYVPKKTDESVSENNFVVKGKDTLKEVYLGKEFLYSIQGFSQNNHEVAEKMHEYCNNIFKSHKTKEAVLLDLYGGIGTFGINNAELFKEVIIVESYKQSVESAKKNILINNIKNAKAIELDAKQLKKIEIKNQLFVLTDPPRSGMDQKTIEQLKKLRPKVIVYISCNVQQLKKDIVKFKDYNIKSAALFDLFPQTWHSEVVV